MCIRDRWGSWGPHRCGGSGGVGDGGRQKSHPPQRRVSTHAAASAPLPCPPLPCSLRMSLEQLGSHTG
eukprot:7193707-Prymnesium_polylepis.1